MRWKSRALPDCFSQELPTSVTMRCMQGTTIEITLWRGIADKFYEHIEEGQVG